MRVILKQNWRIYWRVILIVVAYLKLQLDPREYVNSQIKLGNNFLSCNEMVFFILQVLPIPNPTEEKKILMAGIRWNQGTGKNCCLASLISSALVSLKCKLSRNK